MTYTYALLTKRVKWTWCRFLHHFSTRFVFVDFMIGFWYMIRTWCFWVHHVHKCFRVHHVHSVSEYITYMVFQSTSRTWCFRVYHVHDISEHITYMVFQNTSRTWCFWVHHIHYALAVFFMCSYLLYSAHLLIYAFILLICPV